jgi:uncharacterized membrane protein YuzA (DUF378 family)
MNKPKQYILGIAMVFLLAPIQTLFSQEGVKKDSSNITVTYFKDTIKERYEGNDFNYAINDTGGVNLIQSVLRKFFNWLNDIFGIDIDVDYKSLEYIVYSILGIGALYLLIKFLMQSPMSSVFKTDEKTIEDFKYVEENLDEVNFEDLIDNAIKEQNYRLATRYLYLKSLKILTNKNSIEWHYDKTNSDYLNEIKDQNTKSVFKRISYIYEYVWYGEFPIDEDSFQEHQIDFAKINTVSNG